MPEKAFQSESRFYVSVRKSAAKLPLSNTAENPIAIHAEVGVHKVLALKCYLFKIHCSTSVGCNITIH